MHTAPLRLATRGSRQALGQANVVAAAIEASTDRSVELVLVETTGDVRQDVPLHTMGGQGVFVKEVQRAVLDGRADLAVHSAKDLPSDTAEGLDHRSVHRASRRERRPRGVDPRRRWRRAPRSHPARSGAVHNSLRSDPT